MDFIFIDNYYVKDGKLYGDLCTTELRMDEYVTERQKGLSWKEIDKRDTAYILKHRKFYRNNPDNGLSEYFKIPDREYNIWIDGIPCYYKDDTLFLRHPKYKNKEVILIKEDIFFMNHKAK